MRQHGPERSAFHGLASRLQGLPSGTATQLAWRHCTRRLDRRRPVGLRCAANALLAAARRRPGQGQGRSFSSSPSSTTARTASTSKPSASPSATRPERREVILADFDKQFPEWNDKVADLVWELRPPSMLPRARESAGRSASCRRRQRGRIIDILARPTTPTAGKALLDVLQADVPAEVRDKVIDNLKLFLPSKWAGLRQSKELTGSHRQLLAKPETRADRPGPDRRRGARRSGAEDRGAASSAKDAADAVEAAGGQDARPAAVGGGHRARSTGMLPKANPDDARRRRRAGARPAARRHGKNSAGQAGH